MVYSHFMQVAMQLSIQDFFRNPKKRCGKSGVSSIEKKEEAAHDPTSNVNEKEAHNAVSNDKKQEETQDLREVGCTVQDSEAQIKILPVSRKAGDNAESVAYSVESAKKQSAVSLVSDSDQAADDVTVQGDTNMDEPDDTAATSDWYEKIRQENIDRNKKFLCDLGLLPGNNIIATGVLNEQKEKNKHKVNSRKKRKFITSEILPKRILPRRGVKEAAVTKIANESVDAKESENLSIETPEESTSFENSSVMQYILSTNASPKRSLFSEYEHKIKPVESDTQGCKYSKLVPLQNPSSSRLGGPHSSTGSDIVLQCSDLPAVYSMDFHDQSSSLFCAGGKGGQVAVFSIPHKNATTDTAALTSHDSLDGMTTVQPLLSFRAHKRWLSCAKFASNKGGHSSLVLMLTSADDGLVKLWDVTQESARGTARLLTTATCGHESSKGIFCLDEMGGELLTGCKDRSVSRTRITPAGSLFNEHNYSGLHDAVVKSVSWKLSGAEAGVSSPVVFASGGQDGRVCIKDARCGGAAESVVEQAHLGGVHTVQWCPYPNGSHLLLSAGHDGAVHVYDHRKVVKNELPQGEGQPEHSFGEGIGAGKHRSSKIFTPCFLSASRILIPHLFHGITMHCLLSGETLSRGVLPADGNPVAVGCSKYLSFPSENDAKSPFVVAASNRKGAMHVFYACN